jgi:hypothetical protein
MGGCFFIDVLELTLALLSAPARHGANAFALLRFALTGFFRSCLS